MTVRPVPLQTAANDIEFPGCLRRQVEVRCSFCGRFMSSVVLVIYFDESMGGGSLDEHLAGAGLQMQAGAEGKCLRCKQENAQILFSK